MHKISIRYIKFSFVKCSNYSISFSVKFQNNQSAHLFSAHAASADAGTGADHHADLVRHLHEAKISAKLAEAVKINPNFQGKTKFVSVDAAAAARLLPHKKLSWKSEADA